MDTDNPLTTPLTTASRRGFLRAAAMLGAAAATARILGEPELAHAQKIKMPPYVEGAVYINANENPLGPSEAARRAAANAIANGGRYREDLTEKLEELFAAQNGLNPDYVMAFAGSSQPLHYSVLAFCSPARPLVIADPGYEAGAMAAKACGAPVLKVPLAKDYSHDVRAMCEASPHAGAFYICTPNNPTGTVTRRQQLEYALEHKPQGSILIVDEAYLHFCDEPSSLDMVAAGKDVVVLRTFSKLYGMAGLRLGFVAARPDLLEKIFMQGGWTMCPGTAVAAGMASLNDAELVPRRRRELAALRGQVFEWLTRKGFPFVPSVSNCFMLDTGRPTKEVIHAMQQRGIFIGRAWPAWPTHVRITIGTAEEMRRFQTAYEQVMATKTLSKVEPLPQRLTDAPFKPQMYRVVG